MRQLSLPTPPAPLFRADTVSHALLFDEDTRCPSRYRTDSGADYLPHYLALLKCRPRRRTQHP